MVMRDRCLRILLVEDDPGDA
ncbi:hypothetical protein LCGC14_3089680, partial [marine sediment metagenome]